MLCSLQNHFLLYIMLSWKRQKTIYTQIWDKSKIWSHGQILNMQASLVLMRWMQQEIHLWLEEEKESLLYVSCLHDLWSMTLVLCEQSTHIKLHCTSQQAECNYINDIVQMMWLLLIYLCVKCFMGCRVSSWDVPILRGFFLKDNFSWLCSPLKTMIWITLFHKVLLCPCWLYLKRS